MADRFSPLPIDDVLDEVMRALDVVGVVVLAAPPGAGKTTRVPLALLDAPWRNDKRIIVLEPRRIAARAAAERMAALLGETLGQTVGLRARLNTKVGQNTRIEVVTEGVFSRMIIDDPELTGVAAVLFDEFHERSLDADFGLALARDARHALRPDLRIAVMSATLDTAMLSQKLNGCPVVTSDGRMHPVETRYVGRVEPAAHVDKVAATVVQALAQEKGSILAFLPGQGEIRRVEERLKERLADSCEPSPVDILPLYGALSPVEQDRAIAACDNGRRKVVLATAIAETSLTIDGVRIVIDSGLARVPRFDAEIGITRLVTTRVSRASADQRRGRAGRTEPGICIRFWDAPETQGLMAAPQPEILVTDLSAMVLDCAAWGALDVAALPWIDAPPAGMVDLARSTLRDIGAIDEGGRLTADGERIRNLPLPPRLAAMVLRAVESGVEHQASELAAVLVERGIGGHDPDVDHRLSAFARDRGRRASDMRRLARNWAEEARRCLRRDRAGMDDLRASSDISAAEILSWAFPERIAKASGHGRFLLANGRAGHVDVTHPLASAPYLVVGDLQGRAAAPRIVLAAACDQAAFDRIAARRVVETDEIAFCPEAGAVRTSRTRRLGAIQLARVANPLPPDQDVSAILARGVITRGVSQLPWNKAQQQLRDRVEFLRRAGLEFPDLSDRALEAEEGQWLQPFLVGKTRLADITNGDLDKALDALLPWPVRQRLDAEAPTHFVAPTGNAHALDYAGDGAPLLAIRVQELFGLKAHPAIAQGRIPITLHLLSPAHRPIQITRDLPGFWSGSWHAVRSDMRGRYPKHVWPEDPASAMPTTRAKPRTR